jgi:hypothetical protein
MNYFSKELAEKDRLFHIQVVMNWRIRIQIRFQEEISGARKKVQFQLGLDPDQQHCFALLFRLS